MQLWGAYQAFDHFGHTSRSTGLNKCKFSLYCNFTWLFTNFKNFQQLAFFRKRYYVYICGSFQVSLSFSPSKTHTCTCTFTYRCSISTVKWISEGKWDTLETDSWYCHLPFFRMWLRRDGQWVCGTSHPHPLQRCQSCSLLLLLLLFNCETSAWLRPDALNKTQPFSSTLTQLRARRPRADTSNLPPEWLSTHVAFLLFCFFWAYITLPVDKHPHFHQSIFYFLFCSLEKISTFIHFIPSAINWRNIPCKPFFYYNCLSPREGSMKLTCGCSW